MRVTDVELAVAGRLPDRDMDAAACAFVPGVSQDRQVLEPGPKPGRTCSRAAVMSWIPPGEPGETQATVRRSTPAAKLRGRAVPQVMQPYRRQAAAGRDGRDLHDLAADDDRTWQITADVAA